MQITIDELLTLIGAKESELFLVRKRNAELEARNTELEQFLVEARGQVQTTLATIEAQRDQ